MINNRFQGQIKSFFNLEKKDSIKRSSLPLKITFVCTGNICRSALAEQLLRIKLSNSSNFLVDSAGIAAVLGENLHPKYRETLADKYNLSVNHEARNIDDSISRSDLIVCMAGEHANYIRKHYSAVAPQVFLLKELSSIVQNLDLPEATCLSEVLTDILKSKDPSARFSDIEDPYKKDDLIFKKVYEELEADISLISDFLLASEKRLPWH